MAIKPTYEELEQRVKELEKEAAQQKQADNEIPKMRGFIQSIIQHSPFFLFALNADGKTILMNQTMLSSLGTLCMKLRRRIICRLLSPMLIGRWCPRYSNS